VGDDQAPVDEHTNFAEFAAGPVAIPAEPAYVARVAEVAALPRKGCTFSGDRRGTLRRGAPRPSLQQTGAGSDIATITSITAASPDDLRT
jgi:hypothetical protein